MVQYVWPALFSISVFVMEPAEAAPELVTPDCPPGQAKAVCLIRRAAEHTAPLDRNWFGTECDTIYASLLHLEQYDARIHGCEERRRFFEKRIDFRLLEVVSRHRRGDVRTAREQFRRIGDEMKAGLGTKAQNTWGHACFAVAAAIMHEPLGSLSDDATTSAYYGIYRSLVVLGEGRAEAAKAILEQVQLTDEPDLLEASYFFALGVIGAKLIEMGKAGAVLAWLDSVPMNWRSHGQIIVALLDNGYGVEARALAARFLRDASDVHTFLRPWARHFDSDMPDIVVARAFIRRGEHLAAAQIVAGARAFRKSGDGTLLKSGEFSPAETRRLFDETEGINPDRALARLAVIYSAEGKFVEAASLAKDEKQLKAWLHAEVDGDPGDPFFLMYALYEAGKTGLAEYGFEKWHRSVFQHRVMYFNKMRALPGNIRFHDRYDQFFVKALEYYHSVRSGGDGSFDSELQRMLYELEYAPVRDRNDQDHYRLTKAIIYQAVGIAARNGHEISVPGFFLTDRLFFLHAAHTAAGLLDGRPKPCEVTHYLWGYHTAPAFRSVESVWMPGGRNRYLSCCINWGAGTLVTFYEGR